jgi:hypothetical protein
MELRCHPKAAFRSFLSKLFSSKNRLLVFVLLYFTAIIVNLYLHQDGYFWDFKVYYSAAKCLNHGLNPYYIDNLFKVYINVTTLPFMYPPLAIYPFKFFALFDVHTAVLIFFTLKLIVLGFLVYLWCKIIPASSKNYGLFGIFILFSFNSALYTDLYTGNISVFEQCFIWLGIYFLLQNRLLYFCLLIVGISAFKILPIVFIGFVLFTHHKQKYFYFVGALCFFALYLLANYFIAPDLTKTYISMFDKNAIREGGISNPSTYEFIKSIGSMAGISPRVCKIIFVFVVSFIGLAIIRLIFMKIRNDERPVELKVVLFLCLTTIIILPRFKDYTYILAIPPVYFILLKMKAQNIFALIFLLTLLSSAHVTLPFWKEAMELLWSYYPLILVYIFWWMYWKDMKMMKHEMDSINFENQIN